MAPLATPLHPAAALAAQEDDGGIGGGDSCGSTIDDNGCGIASASKSAGPPGSSIGTTAGAMRSPASGSVSAIAIAAAVAIAIAAQQLYEHASL